MRSFMAVFAAFLIVFCGAVTSSANDREQELVDRFLKRTQEKHTKHIGFASVNFSIDRINRNNDYNAFADYTSEHLDGANLSWLSNGMSIGGEVGLVFKNRFAWSIGGEYWMKMGESLTGDVNYDAPLATSTTVREPKSEISVLGFSTGVQYYPFQHPKVVEGITGLSFRVGGTAGFYMATWDLWQEHESFNLVTSQPEYDNIAFKGTALGVSANVGADLPTNFLGLVMSADLGYQMLNFGNVAWYNSNDEEIVASYNGKSSGRVDLDLSGIRGKLEVKKFFSW